MRRRWIIKRLLDWEKEKNNKIEDLRRQVAEEQESKINAEKFKKKKMNDSLLCDQPAYDRLYKYNQIKPQRRKELEEKMLKDIGASFTPKTNTKKRFITPTRSTDAFLRMNKETPKMRETKEFVTEFQKINTAPRPLVPHNFFNQKIFNQRRESDNNIKVDDSNNSFNFSPKSNSKKERDSSKKLLSGYDSLKNQGDTQITFGNDDPLLKMRILAKQWGVDKKESSGSHLKSSIDRQLEPEYRFDNNFNREVIDIKAQLKAARSSSKSDLM